jgi:hypothetical protein
MPNALGKEPTKTRAGLQKASTFESINPHYGAILLCGFDPMSFYSISIPPPQNRAE